MIKKIHDLTLLKNSPDFLSVESKHYTSIENTKALRTEKEIVKEEKQLIEQSNIFEKNDFDKFFPSKDDDEGTPIFRKDGPHIDGIFWVVPVFLGVGYNLKGEVWEFYITSFDSKLASTYLSPTKMGGALGINLLMAKATFGIYLKKEGVFLEGQVCMRDYTSKFEFKCQKINVNLIPM